MDLEEPQTHLVPDDSSEGAVTSEANTQLEEAEQGKTSITFENLASVNRKLLAQTTADLDATTVKHP